MSAAKELDEIALDVPDRKRPLPRGLGLHQVVGDRHVASAQLAIHAIDVRHDESDLEDPVSVDGIGAVGARSGVTMLNHFDERAITFEDRELGDLVGRFAAGDDMEPQLLDVPPG